jgi:hypothetical protein
MPIDKEARRTFLDLQPVKGTGDRAPLLREEKGWPVRGYIHIHVVPAQCMLAGSPAKHWV